MILSIIIPTLNHPTSIYGTVKSIEDAFVYLEKKIEIEIIIVNQTSLKKKIMKARWLFVKKIINFAVRFYGHGMSIYMVKLTNLN